MKKLGLLTLSLMLVTPALAGGAGQPAAKPQPATCRSISAIVTTDPQFSTLATALDAADLAQALTKGEYTLFAPTNAAFAKVPSDQLAGLLNDPEMLMDVLAYHVVAEKATAADLRGATAGTTENGQDVQIKVSGAQIMVNNARVVKGDIMACNGVVHAIDTVLMPEMTGEAAAPAPAPAVPQPAPAAPAPAPTAAVTAPAAIDITRIPALPLSGAVTVQTPATTETATTETTGTETATEETGTEEATTEEATTEETATESAEGAVTEVTGTTIYDMLVADEQFSTLRDLLSDADLTDLLMSGEYTLFAPTDAAFAALPEGTLAAVASDPELLVSLLKYHMVEGKLSTEQVQAGNLMTAAGTALTVNAQLSPVVESSNGLIYPVDAVLLPEGFVVPTVEEVPADTTSEAAPAPAEATTVTTVTTTTTPAPVEAAPAPTTTGTATGGAIAGGNVTAPAADLTAVLQEERFSTVRELLTSADLLGLLTSGEYTVFLPTNDAFAKLDAAKLAAVRANPGQLKQLLSYHVVSGRPDAAALVAAPLTTAEGTTLTLTRDANGLSMDGMLLGNGEPMQVGNANVYVVDMVLLPAGLR